jgi:hypothetical protein
VIDVSPFDEAMQRHDELLLEQLQSELGVSSKIRVFESAEGSLSPLSVEESKAAASQVREAIERTVHP